MRDELSFAGRLRELRAKAQLSQPGLAKRAGLSVSAVRQFEYGTREPSFGSLVKLALGLGVPLDDFHPHTSGLPARLTARPADSGEHPPGLPADDKRRC